MEVREVAQRFSSSHWKELLSQFLLNPWLVRGRISSPLLQQVLS
jgi:hypothetical protein